MGIPIDGATHIYSDSRSVMNNTLKPESVLKKKINAACYHTVHESVAMGESLTTYIDGNENPANLFIEIICGAKRRHILNNILHDVYIGKFKLYKVAK